MQRIQIVRPSTPYPYDVFYEEAVPALEETLVPSTPLEQRVYNNNGVVRVNSEGEFCSGNP